MDNRTAIITKTSLFTKIKALTLVLGLICYAASLVSGPAACAQQFRFPQGGFGSQTGGGAGGEEVELDAQFSASRDGQPAMLFVTANIAEGFHVYALDQKGLPNNGGGPQPTSIDITGPASVRLLGPFRPLLPPKTHIDQEIWTGLQLREHEGQVTWFAPIELATGVDLATLSISGKVNAQACNPQTCIPLEQTFTAQLGEGFQVPQGSSSQVPLAQPAAGAPTSDLSLLTVVGYGLLGGLILNLMPCVLPVIGLKVMSFAKQGGQSRAQILGLNLAYVAGMMSIFLLLATLASLAQFGLSQNSFAWGELNTLTWFKVGMASLVFAMALSFLGVWELPIPGFATSGKATELSSNDGPMGAFMMGVFTTILATPCSGPFLGPVFGFTISQPPSIIYLIFASVGLGMGLPYLLIGAVPSLVRWIPKPGAWMETFKQLMGFVLLATVVWLLSAINHHYFIATLSLLFGIWFACWWVGSTPMTASASKRQTAWTGGTLVVMLIGIGAFQMLTPGNSVLPWQPYSRAALAAAQAEGKTVMVYFSANWCLTCKTNLKLSINRKEVKQLVEENGVVTLLADWTDKNETIKQALLELNSQSIPLMAIYPADPSQGVILMPDLLTKQRVLDALNAAGPSRGSARDDTGGMANAATTTGSGSLQRAAAFR